MKKVKAKLKAHKTVMYLDCLRSIGDGKKLSDAMVLSFLVMKALRDNEDNYDCKGHFEPAPSGDWLELPDIATEQIAVSLNLSFDAVRKAVARIGGYVDMTEYNFFTKFFELKCHLSSDVLKGKRTDTCKKLKGLSMLVYSYLVFKEKNAVKKNPITKDAPVIDTWESTLAEEMNMDVLALTRQIWKLESMGFICRFYDGRRRPYIWISQKPLTREEYQKLLNNHYKDGI